MLLRQTLSLNLPRDLVAEIRKRAAQQPQQHGALSHVAELALRRGLRLGHGTPRTKRVRA